MLPRGSSQQSTVHCITSCYARTSFCLETMSLGNGGDSNGDRGDRNSLRRVCISAIAQSRMLSTGRSLEVARATPRARPCSQPSMHPLDGSNKQESEGWPVRHLARDQLPPVANTYKDKRAASGGATSKDAARRVENKPRRHVTAVRCTLHGLVPVSPNDCQCSFC